MQERKRGLRNKRIRNKKYKMLKNQRKSKRHGYFKTYLNDKVTESYSLFHSKLFAFSISIENALQ